MTFLDALTSPWVPSPNNTVAAVLSALRMWKVLLCCRQTARLSYSTFS
ncbi:hypothetical protein ACIA8R_32950 [Nonomuraea sp. NPDC051191]